MMLFKRKTAGLCSIAALATLMPFSALAQYEFDRRLPCNAFCRAWMGWDQAPRAARRLSVIEFDEEVFYVDRSYRDGRGPRINQRYARPKPARPPSAKPSAAAQRRAAAKQSNRRQSASERSATLKGARSASRAAPPSPTSSQSLNDAPPPNAEAQKSADLTPNLAAPRPPVAAAPPEANAHADGPPARKDAMLQPTSPTNADPSLATGASEDNGDQSEPDVVSTIGPPLDDAQANREQTKEAGTPDPVPARESREPDPPENEARSRRMAGLRAMSEADRVVLSILQQSASDLSLPVEAPHIGQILNDDVPLNDLPNEIIDQLPSFRGLKFVISKGDAYLVSPVNRRVLRIWYTDPSRPG